MASTGERLYTIVEEYSNLGIHRTGTSVDHATAEWFGKHLESRGARVDRLTYQFDRYVADWQLTVDGREIESVPLYYEAVGKVESSSVHVSELDVTAQSVALENTDVIETARKSKADAAVLATTGQSGHLVALNLAPKLRSGFPVVLAPGSELDALKNGNVHLSLDERIEPSESSVVIGHFGQTNSSDTVLIVTPISGWFTCAGERGTGMAVALELAKNLAERWPVILAGTTGHELHHIGLNKFIDSQESKPRAVIHLGASVAAGEPDTDGNLVLASTRRTMTTAEGPTADEMRNIVSAANFGFGSNPPQFGGEAKDLIRLGAPTLSFLGGFPLFHTPADVTENATTPDLMETASKAVNEATHLFVENL